MNENIAEYRRFELSRAIKLRNKYNPVNQKFNLSAEDKNEIIWLSYTQKVQIEEHDGALKPMLYVPGPIKFLGVSTFNILGIHGARKTELTDITILDRAISTLQKKLPQNTASLSIKTA